MLKITQLLRRISGTITTPHYLESTYPPTPMTRSEDGTPRFNFLTEVVFTITIPKSAADDLQPAPLVVLGHGFMEMERAWSLKPEAGLMNMDLPP